MVLVLLKAASAEFGSADALTSVFFSMKSSSQWFAGSIAVSSLGMPWHLIFFLLKRWYFKPLIFKILCHLLQNMYQCYFGTAKDIIRESAVVPLRDTPGQCERAIRTRFGEMHKKVASSEEAEGFGGLSPKAFISCFLSVSPSKNDSRFLSSFISLVI